MPNHFHLIIKQTEANNIDSFLNSLATPYVIYFNHKYHRVGPLFQGVYKGVLIESDEQLLHVSRYVHLNPHLSSSLPVKEWRNINLPYSLPEYLGNRNTPWVKPEQIPLAG